MACIPPQLAKEIKSKMELIWNPKNKHFSDIACQNRKIHAIKENAQIQSYRIENPTEPVPYNIPRNKRIIKKDIKNIQEAFRWGEDNFKPDNFDESFIRGLSYRITPELYLDQETAEYRDIGVRITGSEVTPPYPWKVKNIEIPEFVENIKKRFDVDDLIENMKTAFYAHFNLVRIHPFEDGNGRTSRALQDIILEYFNFPLPVIEAGERMTYYNFLEDAVKGYLNMKSINKKNTSEGEKNFYVFMAGKVNVSLDKVIWCIK